MVQQLNDNLLEPPLWMLPLLLALQIRLECTYGNSSSRKLKLPWSAKRFVLWLPQRQSMLPDCWTTEVNTVRLYLRRECCSVPSPSVNSSIPQFLTIDCDFRQIASILFYSERTPRMMMLKQTKFAEFTEKFESIRLICILPFDLKDHIS